MTRQITILFACLFCCFFYKAIAQTLPTGQETSYNPISTAVPFLTIAPDARHGAMGDAGVATSPDANSQHWNPAKYVFSAENFSFALNYAPWLHELVNDINLAYLAGYYKLDDQQALGASLRYFSMGDIQLTDNNGTNIANVSPNEFAFDVSYSRKLSEKWSGSVALRYIHSDLSGGIGEETYVPGNALASDISFYFINSWGGDDKRKSFSSGINFSNIGSKISYDEGQNKEFLPANMKLGLGYSTDINARNTLTFALDFNKLLVPTPTENITSDGEGGIIILPDNNSDQSVLSAIFSSFSDAPGGFEEELQEITVSTGIEYMYNKQFFVRTGYFYENENKGNRKFFSAGVGVKMKICAIDFSYLIPTQGTSPLSNTMRFTLIFDSNSFKKSVEEQE